MSGDLTPGEIQDGAASDGSFVHATQASDGLSHRHDERNISRLQSQINPFDDTKSYAVGDLTIFETIQRRCINVVAASGGTAFDPDDWTAADSVGLKNVVTVYDEKDFGTLDAQSRRVLNGETVYLIGGSVEVTDPLFVQTLNRVKFLGLGGFSDAIQNSATGGALVITDLGNGSFTGASSASGGSETEFTGATAHGMAVGEQVLIIGNLTINATVVITAVTTNTFTVANGFQGDESGTYNQGAFEIQFEGIIVNGGDEVFSGLFANISDTRCEFKNITTSGTSTLGIIDSAETLVIENYDVSATSDSLQIIDCKFVSIQNVFGQSLIGSADFFKFTGMNIDFVNVSNVILQMPNTFAIFHFPAALPETNPVDIDLEFHVHDCKDTNPSNKDKLFDLTNIGLNETSSNAFVHDNGKHKDSISFVSSRFDVNSGNTAVVAISTAGDPEDIVDNTATQKWEEIRQERFFITDTNGLATYSGFRTTEVLVNYVITFQPVSGSAVLTVLLNKAGDINNSKIEGNASAATPLTLSGNFVFNLNTNNTIKMRIANETNTENIRVQHAIVSITEIK